EYTGDAYELKSLRILYDYVINASKESDRLELYTSWNGEEDLPLTGKKEISIEKLNPESLILRDRELLIIKNKNIYNF
ncbi:TPA: hypothetical protein IP790_002604, partial [Listeria monocytogenes]|nr:hypothetical protein [Listeria monocytogenes]EAD4105203.1 hypothetical protein [Listeria monocytogenes]HAO5610145.1 hypothetical protein [Listeria monocytogenes]